MYFADQPIIHDFDHFIGYLEATAPLSLTKSMKRLQAADLLVLNNKMATPVVVTKNRPTQKDFVCLNVFFYIGLGAELFTIQQGRKGPLLHIQPERMQLYHAMNADERYGFLLQSFWCYLDWEMAFERRPSFEIGQLFETLEKGGAQKKFSFESSGRPMMTSKVLAELLRAFGLFEYTLSTNANWHNNTYIGINTLTLTECGQKILPPLCQERPAYLWGNLDPYMTRSKIERIYGPLDPKEELPLELMDFFAVFKSAFPDWTITTRLYPITQEAITGELTLKVLLAPKCYRVIRISAAVTLEDLHLAIQKVFDFDNDHLYAFFLNGITNYKAGNVFSDPRGNVEEPEYPAHLVSLGEIGLYPGKELLYLFDFGDNWQFLIQVLAIENTSEIDSSNIFKLIESTGKAPEQYPEWEE
jgi:hypothetical protein